MGGKAKFSSEFQTKGGKFGFADGYGEIVECYSIVHQYPANKDSGQQFNASPHVKLVIQRLDGPAGKPTSDPPTEMLLGAGALSAFHPGTADGPDDQSPVSNGIMTPQNGGLPGNVLFCVEDGNQISEQCKWGRFCKSAEDKGFDKGVIDNGMLPDWVGLQARFINKMEAKSGANDNDKNYFYVDQIHTFPYEGAVKAAAKAAAPKAAPKAAAAGKTTTAAVAPKAQAQAQAAVAAAPDAGGDSDEEVSAAAERMFTLLATNLAGKSLVRKSRLPAKIVNIMQESNLQPATIHKAVNTKLMDDEFFLSLIDEGGHAYDADADKITFAA